VSLASLLPAALAIPTGSAADNVRATAARTPAPARINLVEIPGTREFSGRMIARPLQPEAPADTGLSMAGAARLCSWHRFGVWLPSTA